MSNLHTKTPMKVAIYDQVMDWIAETDLEPGSFFPCERELAMQFNTSRITIRQVLDALEENKVIRREKNKRPVFCLDDNQHNQLPSQPAPSGIIGLYTSVPFSRLFDQESNNLTNIVSSVMNNMEEKDRHVAYVHTHLKDLSDKTTWQTLVPSNLAGLIMMPRHGAFSQKLAERINQQNLPTVLIESYIDGQSVNASSVDLENEQGIMSVVSFLASMGHRKLAYLEQDLDRTWLKQRLKGFQRGIAQQDECTAAAVWQVEENESLSESEQKQILADIDEKGITAVVVSTDAQALALKRTLETAGLSIPEDISITGFDDTSDAVEERLTTLSHMSWDLGAKASEIMHRLLSAPNANLIFRERIMPRLIVRDSVAECRQTKSGNKKK